MQRVAIWQCEDMPMMQKFWFIVVLVIVTKTNLVQKYSTKPNPKGSEGVKQILPSRCRSAVCHVRWFGVWIQRRNGITSTRRGQQVSGCSQNHLLPATVIMVRILNDGNNVFFVWLYYFWMSMATLQAQQVVLINGVPKESHIAHLTTGAWSSTAPLKMRSQLGGAGSFPTTASTACGQLTIGSDLQLHTGDIGCGHVGETQRGGGSLVLKGTWCWCH